MSFIWEIPISPSAKISKGLVFTNGETKDFCHFGKNFHTIRAITSPSLRELPSTASIFNRPDDSA